MARKKNILIGLTGGIAAGKSAVAALFKAKGVPVISADELAREITAPGSAALKEIAAAFGPQAIDKQGKLDRAYLRRCITEDASLREQLNQITHPRIQKLSRERAAELHAQGKPLVVYEAPLLFEAKSDRGMDQVICVTAPDELRVERILARDGVTREDAEKLLAAQMPQEEKAARSDYVVENKGDKKSLEKAITKLLAELSG